VERLVHRDDFLDLGHPFLQDSLDPHFHRHGGAGAALAGPLQTHPDGIIFINTNQLDITPMALQSPTNGLNRIIDPVLYALIGTGLIATTFVTHRNSPKNSFDHNYTSHSSFGQPFLLYGSKMSLLGAKQEKFVTDSPINSRKTLNPEGGFAIISRSVFV
jgi:hypothetical protein